MSRSFLVCVLFLSFVAACGGPGQAVVVDGSPKSQLGFSSQAQSGIVWVEGRFYTNHERVFREDLIDEFGIVPIALKIGLRGPGHEIAQIRIAPQDMDLRLYLQDGTLLDAVDHRTIAEDDEELEARLTNLAFKPTLLDPWSQTKEQFVFFRLRPRDDYEITGSRVVHRCGEFEHIFDLSNSVCSFQVLVDNEPRTIFVGLDKEKRGS